MGHKRILQIGRNCWRICRADNVAFLINEERYFESLYHSLPLALQQILILTGDITGKNHPPPTLSPTLRQLLIKLLKQKTGLHVNILSWDFTQLSALSKKWLPIYKPAWTSHSRLKFNLDNQYPQGASHHQKMVVIDDALAFSGNQDLMWEQRDTSHHDDKYTHYDSLNENSLPIKPYQDVQMAVAGSTAAALGSLARERWRRVTSERLPLPQTGSSILWPKQLRVDIEDVDVAIVRTEPAYGEYTEVREVEQLYLDSIAAAQDYIYIENQFFSVASVSDALAKRLAEKDGPEVILNLPYATDGLHPQTSQNTINPDLLKALCKADEHEHLAMYYLHKPETEEQAIKSYAKVMIMDERFIRIGSANLNDRSMTVNTECDLAIEATRNNSHVKDAICGIRNRLLARHLDCTINEVDQQVHKQPSLIQCIESLRNNSQNLKPLQVNLRFAD